MFTKLTLLSSVVAAAKDGISFVVVGDFAKIADMKNAKRVFDDINQMKKDAVKDSPEDFEFFVTTGDNIYVLDATNPTEDEFT